MNLIEFTRIEISEKISHFYHIVKSIDENRAKNRSFIKDPFLNITTQLPDFPKP